MNRHAATFLLLGAVLVTRPVSAESSVSPADENEWVQIRKLKDVYEQASQTGKFDALESVLAPNFTAVMVTGEEVKNIQQLKDYNAKMRELIGAGGSYSLKASYEPGVMLGTTALGFGSTDEHVTTSEHHEYHFNSRWTALVTKQDGVWKLLRVHISMDPLQNTFVTTFRGRATQLYGGIGIGIGLLLGALIGRSLARRQA